MNRPTRKKLPHEVPPWIPDRCRHFITINAAKRGVNTLARPPIAPALLDSIAIYETSEKWFVHAMVVMPDHLHLIATFSHQGIRPTISPWKSFQHKRHGIEWQSDFFEHRLRDETSFTQKIHYTLQNPVRRGLVQTWRDWPYTFVRGVWPD